MPRAAAELRANGRTLSATAQPGKAALTAQERRIATLAATGLTNKRIAERLLLSHRTTALTSVWGRRHLTVSGSRAAV
ncbi:LuxR C-terminal-related transcriptional regulator [Streptomyces shenzhenensis]|uniref:LuxR C-terminal-related transcriptional regulator n=1 Tax=Streptomyces shenzhenensis TaxID=943815 RepID=UPI002868167C|nr:LuxR C-terminal-related transcriptional regulator [Streptomyces shenzhenensis]